MAKYWDDMILQELVQLLRDGKLYLLAGAGLSQLAGYPSWEELLKQFANAYKSIPTANQKLVDELPTLVANNEIGIIEQLLSLGIHGTKEYAKILKNNFFGNYKYDVVHQYLLDLPFAGYITTNYDLCFESASKAQNKKVELTDSNWFCYPKNKYDYAANKIEDLRSKKPYLLHMHGCVERNGRVDVDNIILIPCQYGDFYKNSMMNVISDTCFYENLLILGTSLKDPYFMKEFRYKRSPSSRSNVANREKCFVVRHRKEKSVTPVNDETLHGIVYDYFDDYKSGLKNMIEELASAYKTASATIKIKP